MAKSFEYPRGPERRRHPRGGRRTADIAGYTPLVFVVDDAAGRRDVCEAILAKLRFAVAPFESVEQALGAMKALRPEAVVVRYGEADAMRERVRAGRDGDPIPVVGISSGTESPESVVEALRRALRLET